MTDTITTQEQRKFDVNRDYLVGNNFLSDAESDLILSDANEFELRPATIFNDGTVDKSVRDCKVAFFDRDQKWGWLYDRIQEFITVGNDRYFKFDIYGFEPMQFVVYDRPGSHYEMHIDSGSEYLDRDFVRKLSFTIQLTQDEDYQGCDLEFFRSANDYVAAARPRGSITVFSSFIPHQVTPLESGVRAAIVGWIYGPPFR